MLLALAAFSMLLLPTPTTLLLLKPGTHTPLTWSLLTCTPHQSSRNRTLQSWKNEDSSFWNMKDKTRCLIHDAAVTIMSWWWSPCPCPDVWWVMMESGYFFFGSAAIWPLWHLIVLDLTIHSLSTRWIKNTSMEAYLNHIVGTQGPYPSPP